MLIVCPACETSYQVEAASLGENGRSVRCAKCQEVWFAEAPQLVLAGEDATADEAALVEAPPAAYEEPAARHEEWWAGQNANETEVEPEPSPAAGEWGIPPSEEPVAAEASGHESPTGREIIPINTEAPPLVPLAENPEDQAPGTEHPDPAIDIETVAARGAKIAVAPKPKRQRKRPVFAAAALVLITIIVGLIAGRAQVVRHAPQTAGLYAAIGLPVNLRGLEFKEVRISGENENDVPVLVVQGTIVNAVNRPVEVPRMRFALLNPSGIETYAWTALPARTLLGEGETLAFRSRLASPPADIRDVQVRFFSKRDRDGSR